MVLRQNPPPNLRKPEATAAPATTANNAAENTQNEPPAVATPPQPTAVPSPQLLPQMIPAANNPQMVLHQSSFVHPSLIQNQSFINPNNPTNPPQLFPATNATIQNQTALLQNGNSSFIMSSQPQNQQLFSDSTPSTLQAPSTTSIKPEPKRTRFAPY
jgi:hypothetical protein